MCGITGFAGIQADYPSVIASMIDSIKHRGPNSDGYCLYEDLALGMTRLSIVDIDGGAQPMHARDSALSIVFNGEIYNYRELAREYQARGGILHTQSDTEVILALYAEYQEACLEKLRGMFTFAILDRREKSLFIARDRLGIKPLYFWHEQGRLIFGSEIKALLASRQFQAEANPSAVTHYLSLRYVPGSHGLFKGVQRLTPGHWLKWQGGRIQQKCYWRPGTREKHRYSDAEFQEQFTRLFEQSVSMHQMADVPHGAYLSGGLDSTTIVGALTKQQSTPIKTFTVGFNWKGDELKAARETAKFLGTDHHEVICQPQDFEYLPKIIWHSDEPLGDPIVLPTYMLAKTASQTVKVVLTGEGADEILAGYLFHKAIYLASHYRRWIFEHIHRFVIKPLVRLMPTPLLNTGFNYPGYLGKSGKQRLLSFLELSRDKNSAQLLQFFISLFDAKEKTQLLTTIENTALEWSTPQASSVLDEVLQMQYADWLPDNILMRQDKMSMAHGLEARVPFLDHKLVEFMETVPDHLKMGFHQNKILLRNYAAKNNLPQSARRKKNAFYFPMEEYFRTPIFQDLLANTLGESPVKNRGLFRHKTITNLMHKMKNKDFLASKQIFALISLELWFQIFIDKKYTFNEPI